MSGNDYSDHVCIFNQERGVLFNSLPHGATAPSRPGPHYRGFMITLRHTTLGRTPLDEGPARRRDNTQHSQETDIHALGGIRTRNPSKRAAADPHLRQRGHWGRLIPFYWNKTFPPHQTLTESMFI